MANCKEVNPNQTDFKNPNSILKSLLNLFKLSSNMNLGPVPSQTLTQAQCGGFNASEIAAKIIKRQADAGIPVGPLPSGEISPDEIMERIRVEEMVEAISTKLVMSVAIEPGTVIQGTGGNAGGPIQVAGTVVGIAKGKAMVCN